MYRLGIEAILGLSRLGDTLKIDPCIPGNWPGFKVDYCYGTSHYKISVENPAGVCRRSTAYLAGWKCTARQPGGAGEGWSAARVAGCTGLKLTYN